MSHKIPCKNLEGQNCTIEISEHVDTCPNCGQKGVQEFIFATLFRDYSGNLVEALYRCPNNKCKFAFFAYYTAHDRLRNYYHLSRSKIPFYYDPQHFPKIIDEISANFSKIYNQARIAEECGLDQIAGCGYRKSIEFLVKDYLKKKQIKTAAEVKSMRLGDAIKAIGDVKIQSCAERATWLGNDETHYEKIWKNLDINNLKDLIRLTVIWVESEALTEKYRKKMPKKP